MRRVNKRLIPFVPAIPRIVKSGRPGNAQYLTSTDMPRSLTGGLSETLIPTAPYFTLGGRIAYTLPDGTTLSVNGTDLQAARIKASPYPELQRELYAEVSHKF